MEVNYEGMIAKMGKIIGNKKKEYRKSHSLSPSLLLHHPSSSSTSSLVAKLPSHPKESKLPSIIRTRPSRVLNSVTNVVHALRSFESTNNPSQNFLLLIARLVAKSVVVNLFSTRMRLLRCQEE